MKPYLKQYVQYVQNTGQRPLAISAFDEDWEPVGPRVREELEREGLIEQSCGALMLTFSAEDELKAAP